MSRLLARVRSLVKRGSYWILDYLYVSRWHIQGLVRRKSTRSYVNAPDVAHATPIILIPGIYEPWSFMEPIARFLHDAGYSVHIIETIGYNLGSVVEVAEKVTAYATEHKLENSIIIAHSKGGLVGKYLLMSARNQEYFIGLIALNTPFSGSKYAYLFPQKSLRAFSPTSSTVSSLAINEVVNANIVSIYGMFDPHIPGGSYLKGAKNIQLETYGHFRVLNDTAVHTAIRKALKTFEH